MKKIVFILFLFSSISINAQKIDTISKDLDSILMSLNQHEALEFITELKHFIDIKYYTLVFETIPERNDTIQRFVTLNHIRSIPVAHFTKVENYEKAKNLYLKATRLLIRESRGNLTILNKIKIIPAFQAELYPFLKRAIENAGGKWDRGEIPDLIIRPPIKGLNNEK